MGVNRKTLACRVIGNVVPTPVGVNRNQAIHHNYHNVVPTPVGVNRRERYQLATTERCPHARGGEPIR